MRRDDLYQRLGGLPGVSRIVLDLYDRVMASERLEPYFRQVDMRRLVEHQATFLGSVMGGPHSYSDAELTAVHAGLDIDRAAFREMIELLRAVLDDSELSTEEVAGVVGAYEDRELCIVAPRRGPGSRVA